MPDHDFQTEFETILTALHERELTSWEKERLWSILAEHPALEDEFVAHCQLPSELNNLSTADLEKAGLSRPPSNIITLPSSEALPQGRSIFPRVLALTGVVAAIILGVTWIRGSGDAPTTLNTEETKTPSPEVESPLATPNPEKRQARLVRRENLSLDDPTDEAVALSGAAALSNSRSPRGGEASGIHVVVPSKISFNHHVRPILSENCSFCHGTDENERKADLRLDTYEGAIADLGGYAAIVPGDHEASELWNRIQTEDPDDLMPPKDSHRTLSSADKEILRRWIDEGAAYDTHWAFKTPERPAVPEVATAAKNPIDAYILRRLESAGLPQSDPAEPHVLARRLHLDLTGLPPTPEETRSFVESFQGDAPLAIRKRIDLLLASPHYGEKMALAWLDAARYSDSNGFQQDGNRNQWPWRDWVVRAYNDNMPFDRFTIEQVAGDLLENPTQDQLIATAFNRNHMLNGEGGAIKEEQRINYVIDRVDTTATTWLGLTMACAQCHSHKYDPITHRDYYQFFAFFNNVPETGGVDKRSGNGCQFGSKSTTQVARPVLRLPEEGVTQQITERKAKIAALQELITNNFGERKKLEKQLLDSSDSEPTWTTLTPKIAKATHQTLTIGTDQSITASGDNPDNDDYTITFQAEENTTLRHLRLEALQEASHTNNGKGLARSNSGNFVLTEIEISIDGTTLPIASARASYEQKSFDIENTFDNDQNTGWAVHRGKMVEAPESAIFTLAEPADLTANTTIQVVLRHHSAHKQHNIGRFRISGSDTTTLSTSKPVIAALLLPPESRDDAAKKLVEKSLRSSFPEYGSAQNKVDALNKEVKDIESQIPEIMVMEEQEKVRPTHILERGDYLSPTDLVTANTPAFLPPLPDTVPKNRLGLAHWMVSSENPLVARVAVNRIWAQFMGSALVKTSEDFGVQGELPSHPDLLDWLAVEFVESGWDIKHLIRLILTSESYQQRSNISPDSLEIDPENRLYSRATRQRLPAMLLRDQALALGGLLQLDVGGHPVFPHQPEGLWKEFSFGKIEYPHPDTPQQLHRRSLYTFWRRTTPPPNMFDTATRQVCTVKTTITNTPLQSLILLNDITYLEAARGLAHRISQSDDEAKKAIDNGFQITTGRLPTPEEQKILTNGYHRALKEFQADPEATLAYALSPEPKLAAYVRTAQLLLNLDETLNRN